MSSEKKIAVDRRALWTVLEFLWGDQSEDYLATAAEDRPCHIFACLVTLVEDMARAGDPDALALVPASIRDAAAKELQGVFEL